MQRPSANSSSGVLPSFQDKKYKRSDPRFKQLVEIQKMMEKPDKFELFKAAPKQESGSKDIIKQPENTTARPGTLEYHQYRILRRREQIRMKNLEEEAREIEGKEQFDSRKAQVETQMAKELAKRQKKRMKRKAKKAKTSTDDGEENNFEKEAQAEQNHDDSDPNEEHLPNQNEEDN